MKKIIVLLTCLFVSSANAGIILESDVLVNQEIHNHYFTTTGSGLVTIDVTDTFDNGDGFDSEINLFTDDGSLDLADFLINNDDGFNSGFGSSISMFLDAGNYLLRIGSFDFGNDTGTDAVIIADTNSGGLNGSYTDYDLSISGQYVADNSTPANSIPEPSLMALFAFAMAGLGFSRKRKSA